MTDRREEIARIIAREAGLDFDALPQTATYLQRKSTVAAYADQGEVLYTADAILSLPPVQGVTEEAVEAACKTYFRHWDNYSSDLQDEERPEMRRVLDGYESTRTPAPVEEGGLVARLLDFVQCTFEDETLDPLSIVVKEAAAEIQRLTDDLNGLDDAVQCRDEAEAAITAKDEEIKRLRAKERTGDAASLVMAELVALIPFKDTLSAAKNGRTLINYFRHELDRATTAERKLEEARKALEFYASDDAWTQDQIEGPNGDYGTRARAFFDMIAASPPAPTPSRAEVLEEALDEALTALGRVVDPKKYDSSDYTDGRATLARLRALAAEGK